jgi:membrane protein
VWGVKSNRSFARKVIDYTAILFLLPILMICSSGVSILMSSTVIESGHLKMFTPALMTVLDLVPFLLTWLSFTGMYMLFPNTKVKFKNAFGSGIFAGTAYQILQYLFVTGQVYVSKYNAIYGSFAFLPLLLIWLQLVWSITLAGAVLCYSSQNIFQFNFESDISSISLDYKRKISVVIMTLIVKRFQEGKKPLTLTDFAALYHMPSRLVTQLLNEMIDAGLIVAVYSDKKHEDCGYQPATDIHRITLGTVMSSLNAQGSAQFIPNFKDEFGEVIKVVEDSVNVCMDYDSKVLLMDLSVNIDGTPAIKTKH